MDDEAREVLEMTKEELLARRDNGQPATVRKREDFVQRTKRVVDESAADGHDYERIVVQFGGPLLPVIPASEQVVEQRKVVT